MDQSTAPFTDRTVPCTACGSDFIFTAGEQEFYAVKGMTAAPSHCPACRRARRADREPIDVPMTTSAVRTGTHARTTTTERMVPNAPRATPRTSHSRTAPGALQQFPAVCADCGEPTTVPFKPRGDKPIRCRRCFEATQKR